MIRKLGREILEREEREESVMGKLQAQLVKMWVVSLLRKVVWCNDRNFS